MTNFDGALKDKYGPGLRNALNNSNPVFTEAYRNDEDIVGRKAVWSVHTGRSSSTGNRAELGGLPSADRQRYTQVSDDLAYIYHTIKVSGQAKHLTRNDAGSFVRALESELDGAEKDLKNDLARQAFGQKVSIGGVLYSGVIGTISGGDTDTLIMSGLSASEMRYFFKDQSLSVINGTTGAVRGTSTVLSVTASTTTVELNSAIAGTTTNDYVVREGNLGNELNGLRHLFSPTQLYATIDPANVPAWAGLASGSTTTAISEVLLDETTELVETDGDGSSPELYVVEHRQRRKLASLLQAQKRYDGRQMTLTAGWEGLQVARGVLVADRFCPVPKGFAITRKHLSRFVGLDFTWDEDDGKVLFKALDGSDAVEARFKAYINLEAPVRNAHAIFTMSVPTF